MGIVIRPFAPSDQTAARALILEGFRERFGAIDETLNPDLHDIAASYARGLFVVACDRSAVVGTGALTPQPDGAAMVSRMSTTATFRGRGIGRAVLDHLVAHAAALGCTRVVLGTNAAWDDAIAFYVACGFAEIRRTDTGVLFEKRL